MNLTARWPFRLPSAPSNDHWRFLVVHADASLAVPPPVPIGYLAPMPTGGPTAWLPLTTIHSDL